MTPEQIAQMMTEDITTNNGLKPSVKTRIVPDQPRRRRNFQEEWDRHYDNHRFHEMPYQPYDQVPTRVSILPKSAYIQPIRPPKQRPQPRQTERVGLGRRMIIM
jgi:hypothetical protein